MEIFNCRNLHTTLCEVVWWKLSRSVTKILTLCRIHEIFFQKYHVKAHEQSFPTMYIKGESTFGRSQSIRGFLPKNCLKKKQFFFQYQDSGSTDFGGGLGPPIYKVSAFFTCSSKTLGHKLSDELLGRPLAPILSDRRPLENFLGGTTQKCQKMIFLLSSKLLEILILKHIFRVPPCESWRPEDSENV